jgi:uncharacterized membrane protein (DUF485 family)
MLTKKLFPLYLLLISFTSFSQEWDSDPGFGGGSGDPATEAIVTPIDTISIPLFITGIIISFIIIFNKNKQIKL